MANKIANVRTLAFFILIIIIIFIIIIFIFLLSFLWCVRVVKCNSLSILFAKVNGTISLKIYKAKRTDVE